MPTIALHTQCSLVCLNQQSNLLKIWIRKQATWIGEGPSPFFATKDSLVSSLLISKPKVSQAKRPDHLPLLNVEAGFHGHSFAICNNASFPHSTSNWIVENGMRGCCTARCRCVPSHTVFIKSAFLRESSLTPSVRRLFVATFESSREDPSALLWHCQCSATDQSTAERHWLHTSPPLLLMLLLTTAHATVGAGGGNISPEDWPTT